VRRPPRRQGDPRPRDEPARPDAAQHQGQRDWRAGIRSDDHRRSRDAVGVDDVVLVELVADGGDRTPDEGRTPGGREDVRAPMMGECSPEPHEEPRAKHDAEGAIPLDALSELLSKYGRPADIGSLGDLERRFAYRDFAHFLYSPSRATSSSPTPSPPRCSCSARGWSRWRAGGGGGDAEPAGACFDTTTAERGSRPSQPRLKGSGASTPGRQTSGSSGPCPMPSAPAPEESTRRVRAVV
jgi:hypothetical protein